MCFLDKDTQLEMLYAGYHLQHFTDYTAAGYITLVVFSVWSCGSHFSIFSCEWNMSSATDDSSTFFMLTDENCEHAE